MPIVTGVLARVFVDDIDVALPSYRLLSAGADVRRFRFGEVELAWVGPFLLLQVPDGRRGDLERTATLLVQDIDEAAAAVSAGGGRILEGPSAAPNGPRMIARHRDGAIFEYLEIDPPAAPGS